MFYSHPVDNSYIAPPFIKKKNRTLIRQIHTTVLNSTQWRVQMVYCVVE